MTRQYNLDEIASLDYLLTYYVVQISGSVGHLFLLLLTIISRSIHHNGVIINFYLIFSFTLWIDAILLYTGHLTSQTHQIPPSIRIINSSIRMTGMLANTCTTLTVVFRLFISVNTALSTRLAKILSKISDTILILVPWVLSMPFFIAYLARTIPHPDLVIRTPYFCDYNGSVLNKVVTNLTLALMCLILVLAILTAILLIKLRSSQHGLVYVKTSIDVVLGCRILLFLVYSLTTVVVLSGTLNDAWGSFSDGPTLAFGLTGFWAFLLFFIQPDTFNAIMTCFGLRKSRNRQRRPSFLSVSASRPRGTERHEFDGNLTFNGSLNVRSSGSDECGDDNGWVDKRRLDNADSRCLGGGSNSDTSH
ncbi:hypothetical protein E3P81_01446 [Wallemia ichthyophaga]|nr:hypothetical protein E3P97_01447 [Wallemia ichthyophaga]TIB05928.1 hypothetical protein E3P96_00757 [Wallemia ichthyophaga]TIB32169.1 hypothetical protein E3P85_01948 [Wallemia ichthyophaga]TIB47984.1 hypothetical protein E3P82_01445 [Wallemia ichthyophaga]TIB52154.1 hypothetical protein E3P81_01446 [Wallemia ichthyophaga]